MAILSKRLMSDVSGLHATAVGRKIAFIDVSGHIYGSQDVPVAVFTKGRRNYALQESINRGEPFILECNAGVLCWVLALEDRRRVLGGVVGGPVFVSQSSVVAAEKQLAASGTRSKSTIQRLIKKIRSSSSDELGRDAEKFEKTFYAVSAWKPVLMKENRLKVHQQTQLAQSIEDRRQGGSGGSLYAFENERALLAHIRSGARNEARSILNRMLSNIYLATTDTAVLRARTVELMSYLTRAAVEDNPLLEPLIRMNHMWTERLSMSETFEELSERLMQALDEFIDAVYVHRLNRGSSSVRTAMDFVYENYTEPISLRQVAAHIGLSPWRTAHIVKEHTGKTVMANILDLRIRRAQQLLSSTDRSCTDICFDVGFNDQSYFTKQFGKLTGMTPTRYRKG